MRNALVLLLLAFLVARPAAAQERAEAAALFPADTIAYAEVDAAAFARGVPELSLVRILADPRLQAFFRPTLEKLGLDPADVAGSLLGKAQVRDWLAGKAAFGVRGVTMTIHEADGKRTVLRVSPDHPFDAEAATRLFGAWTRFEMGGPRKSGSRFSLDCMVVLEPGPKLKEAVGKFLAQPPIPLGREKVNLGGRDVLHLTLRVDADTPVASILMPFLAGGIYADLSGDRWILATDKETMAAAVQGGARGGLTATPVFAKARGRFTAGHALAFAYVDAAALVRTVKPCIPPIVFDLCERNGIAALQGLGFGMSISEGGVRESLGVLLDGDLRGVWKLLDALPGGMRSVAVSPPGALAVVGFKFDGKLLRRRVGEVLRDLALVEKDEDVSALLAGGMRGAGLDLEKDVLPAFGDEAAVFVFPPSMGPIPQLVVGLDLGDEAAFRKLLQRAQEAAAAGGEARFEPLALGEGIEATQVFTRVPMTPCFSVHKDHFFAASSPDLLKKVLLEWGAEGAPSLLKDDEVFAGTLKGLNGGSSGNLAALAYFNLRAVIPPLYGMLPMMGAQLPAEWFDRTQPLDAARLAKHFTGVAAGLRVDGHGVTLDLFTPTGLVVPGWVAVMGKEAEVRVRQVQVAPVRAGPPASGIRTRSLVGDHVRIEGVVEDGPAERAGLRPGDLVLAVDGTVITGIEQMDEVIGAFSPGDTATFTVRRGDATLDVDVRLGAGGSDVTPLTRDLTSILKLDLDEAALERLEWRDYGKGVQLAKLARQGQTGLVLYRAAAGAPRDAFATHRHVGGEAYLVLKGVIADEFDRYTAGTFVWLPAGSKHTPWTEGETVVLVLWPEGVKMEA